MNWVKERLRERNQPTASSSTWSPCPSAWHSWTWRPAAAPRRASRTWAWVVGSSVGWTYWIAKCRSRTCWSSRARRSKSKGNDSWLDELGSVVHVIHFYIDVDSWNCCSTAKAKSRDTPGEIESSSTSYPELMFSILQRKSSMLSRPCDGPPMIHWSQSMFARLVLSTAMFALSNSSMQDRCIPLIRSLLPPLELLASTPSSVSNGSMSLRSDSAIGFDGSQTMFLSRVVAAVTKM